MINYQELLIDTRTMHDTAKWNKLLRSIPLTYQDSRGEILLRRLWTWRSIGTKIVETVEGNRLYPIIEPGGWENEEQFNEFKMIYLKPYAREIKELLGRL
jgi:hypothetical protein